MGDLGRRCLTVAFIAGVVACAEPSAPQGEQAAPDNKTVSTEPGPGPTNALPDSILSAVRSDLAARSGAAVDDVRVVSARAMRWNDGSMGCPQPGQSYMQVLVDGYQVILEAGGKQYDYRTNARGGFVLCEQPGADPGDQTRDPS
jgi:hypothetical protein